MDFEVEDLVKVGVKELDVAEVVVNEEEGEDSPVTHQQELRQRLELLAWWDDWGESVGGRGGGSWARWRLKERRIERWRWKV